MKGLIVNADDFGFTEGTNDGIIQAFQNGIVTSTTILANGDAFDHAVDLARQNPKLGVGCHLSLIGGKVVARAEKVPQLADDRGFAPRTLSQLSFRILTKKIKKQELINEFHAQVERILSAGITPTHFDTHKHSAVLNPVMDAMVEVAQEFGIGCVRSPFERPELRSITSNEARHRKKAHLKQTILSKFVSRQKIRFNTLLRKYNLRAPDYFFGTALTGMIDEQAIRGLFSRMSEGITELMCHPGISDQTLKSADTRLKEERQRELSALTSSELPSLAKNLGIELISYRELAHYV